jgi:hypothetical protein
MGYPTHPSGVIRNRWNETSMNRQERLTDLSPTRRALLGAGIATLALSLALSIAPAWAKNTNAGTVKIHDVSTGTDYDDSVNDPTVCTFTIVFAFPDSDQTGTWDILQQDSGPWTSTGRSGTYDASGDGIDQTDPITLDAGHYKVEYQATGSHSTKSKTFTVGDECGAAGASASPSESPSSDPSSAPSDDAAPTATPTATPSSDPSDAPGGAAVPTATPTVTPSSTSEPEEGAVEAVTASSQPSATPPQAAPAADPTTTQLPDTSITDTVPLTSLLTALGLLMIVAAHPFIRRSAHADRA